VADTVSNGRNEYPQAATALTGDSVTVSDVPLGITCDTPGMGDVLADRPALEVTDA